MRQLMLLTILGTWSTICNVWLWILFLQLKARRRKLFLEPTANADRDDGVQESIRVIVPVRNSGRTIEPCVHSILKQEYERFRLTLVDDRSEDDTAHQLELLAQADSQIDLMRVTSLPSGWLGKSHALWQAARGTDEDWLLFLDDDCVLYPKALETALQYARSQDADLLTLWPRHLAQTFWEHALIPLCGAIIALWFGSPEVNQSNASAAFGNGQFLLFRRDAYLRVGGHASVRDAIIEDVPLAEHAKQSGLRCSVASGADLFGVRMYGSFQAIWNGWSRIYVGALRSGVKLAASVLWLFFGNLWPFVAMPAALWLMCGAAPASPLGFIGRMGVGLSALHVSLIATVSYRFWGYGRCERKYLWLYPLSVVVVMGILGQAWWQLVVRRRVSWRNTSYTIDGRARITPGECA